MIHRSHHSLPRRPLFLYRLCGCLHGCLPNINWKADHVYRSFKMKSCIHSYVKYNGNKMIPRVTTRLAATFFLVCRYRPLTRYRPPALNFGRDKKPLWLRRTISRDLWTGCDGRYLVVAGISTLKKSDANKETRWLGSPSDRSQSLKSMQRNSGQ